MVNIQFCFFLFVFFLWNTKGLRNASTSPRCSARITLHTFGPGVFNHPSSKPASLSFYHCHNGPSAFVLQSRDDVWYAALSLVISNDNKSVLVGPQGNYEKWKYAVWVLMLSPYGNVVSLASCRAYYDDKVLRVLVAKKQKNKTTFHRVECCWADFHLVIINACKVVCSFGSNITFT